MSEIIKLNLSYHLTNTDKIIGLLQKDERLRDLEFLEKYNIDERSIIKTPLSKSDDEEINNLFLLLGTTDLENQTRLLDGFTAYFSKQKEFHDAEYEKRRKLYAAFGVSCGLVLVFVLA